MAILEPEDDDHRRWLQEKAARAEAVKSFSKDLEQEDLTLEDLLGQEGDGKDR